MPTQFADSMRGTEREAPNMQNGTRYGRKRAGYWGKRTSIFLVLMITLFVLAGCDMNRAEATRQLSQGMAAFSGGDTPTAIGHMEAALEADPGFAEAAYYLGQVYQMRSNDLDQAARNYRRALDLDSSNARYAYRLATVLAEQGKHEEAVQHFQIALDNEPEYARAWLQKGLSLDAMGEFAEAVSAYTRAIETNPRLRMAADDPGGEHYHALGDLYLRFRLFDHAARVYENGAVNNANSPRLFHGQGVALLQLGRYDEAVEAFESTLRIDPRHGSANFNLVVALRSAGERDQAIAQAEKLIETGAGLNEPRLRAVQALLNDLKEEEEDH